MLFYFYVILSTVGHVKKQNWWPPVCSQSVQEKCYFFVYTSQSNTPGGPRRRIAPLLAMLNLSDCPAVGDVKFVRLVEMGEFGNFTS